MYYVDGGGRSEGMFTALVYYTIFHYTAEQLFAWLDAVLRFVVCIHCILLLVCDPRKVVQQQQLVAISSLLM